jgi:hypothetical protein
MFFPTETSVLGYVSSFSADILVVGGLLAFMFGLGVVRGKDTLITLLLALYPAALLTLAFPYYDLMGFSTGKGGAAGVPDKLLVFVVTCVALFFILRGYVNCRYQQQAFWRFVELTALAVGAAGLTAAALCHVVGIEQYHPLVPLLHAVFASGMAWFLWLLAPLAAIPLFVRT